MALGALRSRRRTEKGAAAVEFALVVPFLAMLLFGMITLGFTFSDYLSAANAVREGARFGASADACGATPPNPCISAGATAWATSVRDRVKGTYFQGNAVATDAQICVKLVQPDGTSVASWTGASCGTEPATPASMAAGSCAVKVWVTRPETISLVIGPDLNFNIKSQSVAFYGRKLGTSCTAS